MKNITHIITLTTRIEDDATVNDVEQAVREALADIEEITDGQGLVVAGNGATTTWFISEYTK